MYDNSSSLNTRPLRNVTYNKSGRLGLQCIVVCLGKQQFEQSLQNAESDTGFI